MPTVAVACQAMATRFEILLHGDKEVSLRAAGEEALQEIVRLESQLSLYQPSSDLSRINARAAAGPVRVRPPLFRLFQHITELHRDTHGAFDVTIGPLMRCWGFRGGPGHVPTEEALAQARSKTGLGLVNLRPEDYSIRFACEGVVVDLGGIGKGYAIEQAVELLREAGVQHALIHGGTSTAYALGHQPDGRPWKIAIETHQDPPTLLAAVPLCDQALSVSAVWGKAFQAGTENYGHVLDPRTGRPVTRAQLAAVVTTSATEADALSTALLVEGAEGIDPISSLRPDLRCLVWSPAGCQTRGIVKANG